MAEITINGKNVGGVWRAPYRVDMTDALTPGRNDISIRVANSCVNRMIGDKQPDVPQPITYSLTNPYSATTSLPPSGLLGPVRVIREVQ